MLCPLSVAAQGAPDNRTVVGANPWLSDGAHALQFKDYSEGIRLTLIGLKGPVSERNRIAAFSNLCAGYVLLGQYEAGLPYCDAALAENGQHWRARCNRAVIYIKLRRFEEAHADLLVGEEVRPNAKALQAVRKMYLDATDPVAPSITIDDRRDPDGRARNDQAGPAEDE